MSKSIILTLSDEPDEPSPECNCYLCEATRAGFAALVQGKTVYANTWRATIFGAADPQLRYMFARWDAPMATMHDLARYRDWLTTEPLDDGNTTADAMARLGFELARPVWLNRADWQPLAKVGTVGNHRTLGPVITLSLETIERYELPNSQCAPWRGKGEV